MGNWQLEVAKMAVYMAFPVTSFYVYHQVTTINRFILFATAVRFGHVFSGQHSLSLSSGGLV